MPFSTREGINIVIVPEASVKNCSLHNFLSGKSQTAGMSPTMNKVIGFHIAESKLIQNKAVEPLSLSNENGGCAVEKRHSVGNTKGIPGSTDKPGHTERPADDVQESLTPMYKIALSVYATKEERRVFSDYQNTVRQAGWFVVSVPVSNLEESAVVIVPDDREGKVRAAAYVAESMLCKVMGGASREWT